MITVHTVPSDVVWGGGPFRTGHVVLDLSGHQFDSGSVTTGFDGQNWVVADGHTGEVFVTADCADDLIPWYTEYLTELHKMNVELAMPPSPRATKRAFSTTNSLKG